MEYKSELHNEEGRLSSVALCKQYQKDRLQELIDRVKGGEPYGICGVDEVEEIFHAFGAPVVPLQYWSAIISSRRLSARYFDYMAKQGYDQDHYYSMGLACTMANDPDAPYGGLPQPMVVVGNSGYDPWQQIKGLWAKELNAPYYPLEALGHSSAVPDRWWETIFDGWEAMCEPKVLDQRVKDMKDLIHFMEILTKRSFVPEKLTETLEIENEHMAYERKIRDLIASTSPCPVSLRDQLAMYPLTWWRGVPSARDLAKKYYEAVLERIENGTCVWKDEKIRLYWGSQGLWQNTKFYHAFEEKYNAVFVGSMYQSVVAEGYARSVDPADPLRTLAGRQHAFGVGDEAWLAKEAELHGCDGAIGQAVGYVGNGFGPRFEERGIPYLQLGGDNVDSRSWNEEEMEARVGRFIEERVIPNMKKKGKL